MADTCTRREADASDRDRSQAADPAGVPEIVGFFGYPGPFTPAIQEVVASFVFPDMCTRVARGESPDAAIRWAVGEYRRIYAKHKVA